VDTNDHAERIEFDDTTANDELVRMVFLRRLRAERASWSELGLQGWDKYVVFTNHSYEAQLLLRALRVLSRLVNEGILYPGRVRTIAPNISGLSASDFSFPYFGITPYGAEVLDSPQFEPHYPQSYLREFADSAPSDATVAAYINEAIHSFHRGALAASMLMLGVAAERTFLMVCESVSGSLEPGKDKDDFGRIMARQSMKAKLDWISTNFQQRRDALPDGTEILVISIYNLVRLQRNDLGHPKEKPPRVTRAEARTHLQMFPTFYSKAQEVIAALKTTGR
jgi:hypothetical protein